MDLVNLKKTYFRIIGCPLWRRASPWDYGGGCYTRWVRALLSKSEPGV